ncbi:hypothetical protein [Streptomyces sp. NPDC047024]|uniref:hypothetical protein n=1 Tax=Streptomyces sp. NPDC047024 TaxID=3155476 RepID=UPI0033F2EC98
MTTEREPDVNAVPAPPDAPEESAPQGRRRRLPAILAVSGLALVTLAGVGVTGVVVSRADRAPGAPVWRFPAAEKEQAAPTSTGLRKTLLPYGKDRYVRGPDVAQFGPDVVLTGRRADAWRKQTYEYLPQADRRLLDEQYEKNPLKAVAIRSYVSSALPADGDDTYTVRIELAQRAESVTRRTRELLLAAMTHFPQGPAVEGHKDDAVCVLLRNAAQQEIGSMMCIGYVGDIRLTAYVVGAAPADRKEAADMVGAQLDRIEERGEAV